MKHLKQHFTKLLPDSLEYLVLNIMVILYLSFFIRLLYESPMVSNFARFIFLAIIMMQEFLLIFGWLTLLATKIRNCAALDEYIQKPTKLPQNVNEYRINSNKTNQTMDFSMENISSHLAFQIQERESILSEELSEIFRMHGIICHLVLLGSMNMVIVFTYLLNPPWKFGIGHTFTNSMVICFLCLNLVRLMIPRVMRRFLECFNRWMRSLCQRFTLNFKC